MRKMSFRWLAWRCGSFTTSMSPGARFPAPNSPTARGTSLPMVMRWAGWQNAWATMRPSASTKAEE